MSKRVWRVVGAGILAALATAAIGRALERGRFGSSDDEALARVEAELRQRFDAIDAALGAMAARVAAERATIQTAARDPVAAARLFDLVAAALPAEQAGRTGITVYDASGSNPVAWAGRASTLPRGRLTGRDALLVAPGALGPRLIRIEPVKDSGAAGDARLATVVIEQSLAAAPAAPAAADSFVVTTSLAPVTVRVAFAPAVPAPAAGTYSFVIPSRSGGLLVEADVVRSELAASRARWQRRTGAVVAAILAVTLLLCAGPFVDVRRRARRARVYGLASLAMAGILIGGRLLLRLATEWAFGPQSLTSPVDLLLTALTVAGLVAVGADLIWRRRAAGRRPPLVTAERGGGGLLAAYFAAGLLVAPLVAWYLRVLERIVSASALDVLHFSLRPIDGPRLAIGFGLVLLHATVVWTAASATRLAGLWRRVPRRLAPHLALTGAWLLGAASGVALSLRIAPGVPVAALLVALSVAGACATAAAVLRPRVRRASQAARVWALFLALLVPALALYPSLASFAAKAKERLIADQYGPLTLRQRDDLKERLRQTLDQIDAMPALASFVGPPDTPTPGTDRAFAVWSRTDLQQYRITSAIELYGTDGGLVSRFALNLPEYATPRFQAASCTWDLFDEPSPFGSSVRHVLTASRAVCERQALGGSIVVRVMLDYTTLPFNASRSPYIESLRPSRRTALEGVPGRDVEFVVYGWSRVPIYAPGTSVWPLADDVFDRAVRSRERFWSTVVRDDRLFRVYFLNDRGGIYALGYPVITWFGHLVNLAELVVFAGVLYVLLLGGSALFAALARGAPTSGRALLREVRASFYWKVFIASLLGAIVPVVVLALAISAYFARQFRDGRDQAAAQTATVAQRLVEDYASLQQRAAGALAALDDQIMVLVARAIDQDVNFFDGNVLEATSERDLFASGLLSTRTPAAVYRRIVFDRRPTFVGIEQVGDFSYLVAAAPVRAGGREGIVTVPQALRQQEIEGQIDELDRQVLFAAVLFSLLGAAVGYWMAERIADPVNRLTRATRRIARGDLDARVAAESADELGRLVRDFNRMADDLKQQRAELERTQRLEAWAEMARQVAHDIKNPLTPIQLSAEHAQRVNADRGRPLSPVLDECVQAILGQVALLRHIAAEFSSFASSPTASPERTELGALLDDVLAPYRAGLAGRITIALEAPADLSPVLVDRNLLARAVTNVVENALHAMPGRGILTVRCRPAGAPLESAAGVRPAVIVEVADTGVGLDGDALARIFEPYFSTKATGTGLGLTIAKRNVELSGGTITVASRRGAGTTVTITVPAASEV